MKDHGAFLNAAHRIGEKRDNVRFLLAGEGADASNERIMRKIRRLALCDKVHLLGQRNDVPRILPALDISVCASAWGEGFPNVIGESMACAVPCVVTDVGDSGRVVGDTGIVVPPRNPEAMAQAWEQIIRLGVEGRAELGRKARKRIEDFFSLASVARDYESLYRRIYEGDNTPSAEAHS
jgi:glycosyltransferase involved in cell wall biosynthesis